ncbi:MAG: helix-turn-helix domain-containing protein [Allomuricauda sp.]
MKFTYSNIKDESLFVLTDFNCEPAKSLLKEKGLYKIIWCKDRELNVAIDGYDITLKKNQVVFCTPLNVLEINEDSSGVGSLVFNREFYCIRDHDQEVSCYGFLFYGSSQPPIVTLSDETVESFMAMHHLLLEEFKTKDNIQGEMLRVLLKRVLIMSRRLIKQHIVEPEMPNAQLDVIRRFNVLVEQNFREKHQVSDYAEMLHKSPKTLSNLFGKYNNKTPLQVINDRILLEAKRLLLFSDKTSEEITYELGYKEASHFSKFFKKNVGKNPSDFRKEKLTA